MCGSLRAFNETMVLEHLAPSLLFFRASGSRGGACRREVLWRTRKRFPARWRGAALGVCGAGAARAAGMSVVVTLPRWLERFFLQGNRL